MSPVKISAIKTHIPTISRISASTINVNNYIEKRSRRSVSRNGSDGTDDDEQIIAVPGWDDDSDEEIAQSAPQSDNEDENSQREPTQYDSDSETEEPQPQPKRKQVRGIKGESSEKPSKTAKNTEKSTKKPSNKKESKVSDEKPKNSRAKQVKKDDKPAPTKGKQKKQVVEEEHISETSKSIAFESDNEDAPVAPPVVEKPSKTPKTRTKSPVKQQKLETANKTPKRQQQLPNLVGKKSAKKRTNRRELTDAIDNDVFTAYREAIAPFFDTIERDGKEISPDDRFEEMDAFYASVEKLASRMEKELGDDYSKHNLQIKKIDAKQSELQYVDGEKVVKAKSPVNGQDILKFFRMNTMKKTFEMDDVEAFLMGTFINTVNVLAIDTKHLSLLDYDRLTLFSHFNDIEYQKPSVIEYNMPAYIKLISKLNKWSFSAVFEARSNWLCVITDTDKEQMWNEAVKCFDAFKAEENNVSENVLNIWDNLIHSQYVKQFVMYCANPNPLFGKIFKLFLETTEYKDDMMVLFEGPLEPIASMFTPLHFHYRGVEYGNPEDKATFSDLVKVVNDPSMYDPRYNAWIARLT